MESMHLKILDNEYWWFGCVKNGSDMPYHAGSEASFDLNDAVVCDQFAPIGLSSKGRYIWSEKSFSGKVHDGCIDLESHEGAEFELQEGFSDLRGAYLAACEKHFPFDEGLPDPNFFSVPQYNTWIELGYNQTAASILNYAKGIIENGLPAGILMIDDGWQKELGCFDSFDREKIPNPEELIDQLHQLGFKVMLWVTPIVASAGPRYLELKEKGYLVVNVEGNPAIRKWWEGYSCVLDLSNPDAAEWFADMLHGLSETYRVDGFKLDAGDIYFYEDDDRNGVSAREQTTYYNQIGERFALNEYRAAWKYGGRPIVARLQDKNHEWGKNGLDQLIPNTLVQGLSGYVYCCPDMVGGGDIVSFEGHTIDEGLFVRWAQASALMGMMQMSIAPWRVLKPENAERVKCAMHMHAQFGEYILQLAHNASKTGEPITRPLCYEFPEESLETVADEFMLGDKYLAAPVLKKGAEKREVVLPSGLWKDWKGNLVEGGRTIEVAVTLDDICYFERQ